MVYHGKDTMEPRVGKEREEHYWSHGGASGMDRAVKMR